MNRTLLNLIVSLIKDQSTDLATVRNLLGSPVINPVNPEDAGIAQHWKIFSLPNVINTLSLPPGEIMDQISTLQMQASPILDAKFGELVLNTTRGTVLATTIVNVPHAISLRLEVDAPFNQIAVYSHQTLIQRGSNNTVAILNIPAGKTAINVVTQGSRNSTVTLNLPPDISTDFAAFLPAPPTWLASGTINAFYIDPSSGHVGVQLYWNNQTNVGGWDIYKVFSSDFGTITQCSTVGGKYVIITNFSGTALLPYVGSIGTINNVYIGVLENASYSVDFNNSTFVFKSFDNGDSVFSGTLSALNFVNIGTVQRNSNDSIVSYTDVAVQVGTTYSYTIDSFSQLDRSLRSDKIQILTVTLPAIPGITGATLTEQTPGYLTLALNGVDPQVRYWSGWLRKDNWPTINGTDQNTQLVDDFLRFADLDASQTTYTFTAGLGLWYGIVVPYDANNTAGQRVFCNGLVLGIAGGGGGSTTTKTPAISQLGIDIVAGRNKVWWITNQAGERPGTANGNIQIQVLAYNAIESPAGPIDITTPNPRYLWQDWEDTNSNSGDTLNTKLLYGSMLDSNARIQVINPKYSVWQYTISIISGTVVLGTYNTSIGGNYSIGVSPWRRLL